jgi:hypothetical protein
VRSPCSSGWISIRSPRRLPSTTMTARFPALLGVSARPRGVAERSNVPGLEDRPTRVSSAAARNVGVQTESAPRRGRARVRIRTLCGDFRVPGGSTATGIRSRPLRSEFGLIHLQMCGFRARGKPLSGGL